MPELPEVETVRRGLVLVLEGQRLSEINVRRRDLRMPIPKGFEVSLKNQKVLKIDRRGKYIIAHAENNAGFILHLGMSGRIRIYEDTKSLKSREKHDHVIFTTEKGAQIVFNDARRFGFLIPVNSNTWQTTAPFDKMGPEPLGNAFNATELMNRLKGRTAPIKNVLLDQRIVAGLGNIYVCEALYYADISPIRSAKDVTAPEAEKLCTAIRDVLQAAIKAGGSSLKDHAQTDGSLGYFQTLWAVYGRAGESCPNSTSHNKTVHTVKRIVQSGRSSFYCPACQK